MNETIKRYCRLVMLIDYANNTLDNDRHHFYDGGHSFKKVHANQIAEIKELESEFIEVFKRMNLIY